ncbi:hypothetical protein [Hymenobacter terrenus]|uniref:hypothetical protein n=1 Tax=Hymenobacter terrenus TaxID=1629124 RepID=UPI0006196A02|nr:hypothetical protein [Hymenobacter terrenus]
MLPENQPTPGTSSSDYPGPYALLEKELAPYFIDKAPVAPLRLKEGFVKYFPWVAVVLLVLLLPVVLAALGLGALLSPFSFLGGLDSGFSYIMVLGLSAVTLVLDILSLSGLFNRQRVGWKWAYYSQLLSILSGVFTFSVPSILMSLLFLYLLFQVRSYYK